MLHPSFPSGVFAEKRGAERTESGYQSLARLYHKCRKMSTEIARSERETGGQPEAGIALEIKESTIAPQ
jgi:hypothetical protein